MTVERSGVPAADNLRRGTCPAGLPWTGTEPHADHGHTDCWERHTAADMLEAIDAHVVTVMAHYSGQDDAYEEGYFDACFKIHSILHPEEGL